MELTRTSIDTLLRTGQGEQSPLADRFISAAWETLGLCIVACYRQTNPHILSVFLHAGRSARPADEAAIGELFARLAEVDPPAVTLDYIDRLALWHLLTDLSPVLNRLDAVRAVGGKVYCGWDSGRRSMAPWVIVSSICLETLDRAAFSADFAAEACAKLARRDKWDAVTPEALAPVVTTWDALTPEERFALLRQ